jgi:pimeloyl-ACP methyl ester carboxylesterase
VQFALKHLLEPFAWAKSPFEERASDLKTPVTFVYGEHDWMDPEAGRRICHTLSKLHAEQNGTAPPLRPAQNECIVIKDSGHHTYMESPETFNKIVLEIALG